MDEMIEIIPFSSTLSHDEEAKLKRMAKRVHYKKGDIINKSSECSGILAIASGHVKVYSAMESGRDITLFTLFKRDLILFTATCIFRDLDFSVHIRAEEDVDAILIPTVLIDEMRRNNIGVSNYLCSVLSQSLSDLVWLIDQILNKRLDKRLSAFLLEQAGIRKSTELEMKHDEIAFSLGSSREVITRTLSYLEKEGIVEVKRGKITIADMEKLEERAGDSIR